MGLLVSHCLRENTVHPSGAANIFFTMTCESCGVRFSFLKKKKRCRECEKDFCSACLIKDPGPRNLLCQTCRVLTAVPPDRTELMKLKVRELRHYLTKHQVPMYACTEKTDLVDLIIRWPRLSPSATTHTAMPPTRGPAPSPTPTPQPPPAPQPPPPPRPAAPNPADRATPEPQGTNEALNVKKVRIEDLLDVNVEDLSSRQLKEILTRSFVAYRGCCEKNELVEKVKRLQNEVRENKTRVLMGLPEESMCKICMDAPVDCVLLECGHMLSCTKCGQLLSECPICRQYVVRVVHIFRA